MSSLPAFSVIIPTYQRRDSLSRVLAGLAAQTYPLDQVEALVVLDGSTDGTAEMLGSHAFPFATRVFAQPNRGPAAARNLALEHCRHGLALFLDDDVIPSPQLLSEHARVHAGAADLAVIGTLLPPEGRRSPWIRYESQSLEKQYEMVEAGRWRAGPRQFYTGNASIRLEHVRRAGGFDPSFRRAEDVELAFRLEKLGVRFVFHRAAAATHIADRPYKAWLRTAYLYGQADATMGLAKGQRPLLDSIGLEFHLRHPAIQRLVRWGLAHPRLVRLAPPTARGLAAVALRLGRPRLSYALCSAIFNLSYWRGLADGMGGPTAVWTLVHQHRPQISTSVASGRT